MIRQTRLAGYTWSPEQKKDYEDLYQSWSASDMAAEIVNLNILQSAAFAREAALQERVGTLEKALRGMVDHAVVLSRSYLETFKDWPDDATIQGWDKARWLRAADAKDVAVSLLREDEP